MRSIIESFGSGVAFQYSSVIALFLSSSFFYFFIAHILPVNIVGSISLLYAIINIVTSIFMFGMAGGIQHYISYHLTRENYKALLKLIRETSIFGLILSLLAFVIIFLLSPYIAILFFHSYSYTLSIKIISIAIATGVLINIFSSILLGLSQYKKYSIIYVFVNTFTYFFPLLLLVIYGKATYLIIGVSIINTVNAALFITFVYKAYKKYKYKNSDTYVEPYKNVIYYSIPLFFSSIIGTSATYIDRIVVSYFINLSYLGIYNFALIVATAATFTVYPISNLLIPKLSSFFSLDNKSAFSEGIVILINIVSLLYIPASLGIAALSGIILYIFAGPAYEIASIPLMIIMFTGSIFISGTIYRAGISSVRKTRIFVLSAGFSLESNLLLSIILIPAFNIIGAAISYSSMSVVSFIILYYYARKLGIANYDKIRVVKIWAAALIMFFILFFVQSAFPYTLLNVFIYILLGIFIYVLEIKFFKLISRKEMNYLLYIIPKRFTLIKNILISLSFNEKN